MLKMHAEKWVTMAPLLLMVILLAGCPSTLGGGVTRINAGINVDVDPASGVGDVTISADGAIGPQGPKGDTGPAGAIGPKGDAGFAGATGPKGDPGATGSQGQPGPQGLKGDGGTPVGSIMAFHTFGGHLSVPADWQECDGSAITDPASPLVGQNTPNLDNLFLMGGSSSGATGGSYSTGSRNGGADLNVHKHESQVLSKPWFWGEVNFGLGTAAYHANGACNAGIAQDIQLKACLTNVPFNIDLNSHTHSTNPPPYFEVLYIVRIK